MARLALAERPEPEPVLQAAVQQAVLQDWLTVKDLVAKSRLSRAKIFQEIAAGRLKSFNVGGCRRVTKEAAAEWQALYNPAPAV